LEAPLQLIGTGRVGSTIRCTRNRWTGECGVNLTNQWRYEDGSVVPGSGSDLAYTIQPRDSWRSIYFHVTACDHFNLCASDQSNSIQVCAGQIRNERVPSIVGEILDDSVVTADPGEWRPCPGDSNLQPFGYRWLAEEVPIQGATGASLQITPELSERQLKIEVTARNVEATAVALSAPRLVKKICRHKFDNSTLASNTSITPESINLTDPPHKRATHLERIVRTVLRKIAPQLRGEQFEWAKWMFLYTIWHESDFGRKRRADGSPDDRGARGLMMIEPRTAWDAFCGYVKDPAVTKLKRQQRVRWLASAAGISVTDDEMKLAINDFLKLVNPNDKREIWPKDPEDGHHDNTKGFMIKWWLGRWDTFGIVLMRFIFGMQAAHSFTYVPGAKPWESDYKDTIFWPQYCRYWFRYEDADIRCLPENRDKDFYDDCVDFDRAYRS
jgi:hypothetical protein